MTPLAHKIVRELTLPKKDRTFMDAGHILPRMRDIHCFEISAVQSLVGKMAQDLKRRCLIAHQPELAHLSDEEWEQGKWTVPDWKTWRWIEPNTRMGFLPAPRTWIETKVPPGSSHNGVSGVVGWLLEEGEMLPDRVRRTLPGFVRCTSCQEVINTAGRRVFGSLVMWHMPLADSSAFGLVNPIPDNLEDLTEQTNLRGGVQQVYEMILHTTLSTYITLGLINTPKLIGRRQHMPHAGLEKALRREQKIIGTYPLHAWTEILLECRPTPNVAGEEDYEAHLTGRKCLHFCRAHLRLKGGKVEFVRSHYRGDPALGFKQARYRVTA